ncbi:MAG: DNA polymerase III subunit delta [Deltaproteobacteria bacterium]|nr:DNA polymerase III subunit delta [Deltaproteobacteria bacterium]MBN2674284.1 DNA polymerase III subunit delta [Deltaproteobacteria bacterium]
MLQLIKTLTPDNVEPLYFLHGEEEFLIDKFLTELKQTVVEGPMADFNYSRQKARETSGAQVVADAKSLPMMAKRRLMIIEDADKFKAADTTALADYIENPAPETCMVLIAKKFDLRKGLFSKANRKKLVHKSEPLKERDIPAFIKQRVKEKRIKISADAIDAIAAAIGSDCAALDDAVERLALYKAGSEITLEDVEANISSIRQHSVFELVDALGERNPRRVLSLLFELLKEREEPLMLNSLLARHMRQLLKARICAYQRMDQGAVAATLGVPPFVVKKLMSQSRQFSSTQLESAIARLAMVDIQLKSSRRPGGRVLEGALMDLCL